MRYPRNQAHQPMYYNQRGGGSGGAKAAAVVLGILCGVLFIAVLAVTFKWKGKEDELASKVNTINEKTQEIDDLKQKLFRKGEAVLSSYITGNPDAPATGSTEYWRAKCKQLEIDLSAEVLQMQFYKNLVPLEILEKAEDVYVKKVDLQRGTDTMYMSLVLVNKSDMTLNNVRGKVRFFNNQLIVKEIPFNAPLLQARSETPFRLPAITQIDHSYYHVELIAGHRPNKRR